MTGTYLVLTTLLFSVLAISSMLVRDKDSLLQVCVFLPSATFGWIATITHFFG